MIIRELHASEQPLLAAFLLDLPELDRYRRFCRPMSDAAIRAYVGAIDWTETVVIAAFDGEARIIGVLELCDAGAASEIGVAVAAEHRKHGVARALMLRALLKAKVLGKERVVLSCLTENLAMRRLAHSVGLTAVELSASEQSELALEQPHLLDIVHDAAQELAGKMSYAAALYSRSCTELMQQAWFGPQPASRE
jgi:RimJ/RimL family protein N-acetyltransferase